jgi:DNA-binding HxlR family transcriptional regulator
LPAALEAVGERWTFLILRGAFNGLHHFEEFQSTLGIARNILSNRLARLVDNDILTREPDPGDRRKVAYRLTPKGRELLPVLVALRQWGERWVSGVPSNPVLVDRMNRWPVAPMAVRAADGRPLALNELDWVDRSEVGDAPEAQPSSQAADDRTEADRSPAAPSRSEASAASS